MSLLRALFGGRKRDPESERRRIRRAALEGMMGA